MTLQTQQYNSSPHRKAIQVNKECRSSVGHGSILIVGGDGEQGGEYSQGSRFKVFRFDEAELVDSPSVRSHLNHLREGGGVKTNQPRKRRRDATLTRRTRSAEMVMRALPRAVKAMDVIFSTLHSSSCRHCAPSLRCRAEIEKFKDPFLAALLTVFFIR